jgi:hypothetical protein
LPRSTRSGSGAKVLVGREWALIGPRCIRADPGAKFRLGRECGRIGLTGSGRPKPSSGWRTSNYHGRLGAYRFPPEIIQQTIWLYLRFTLSLRDVEDLLAERGITVSYESIRRWINHFGPMIAADLRRRRPKPQPTQPHIEADEADYKAQPRQANVVQCRSVIEMEVTARVQPCREARGASGQMTNQLFACSAGRNKRERLPLDNMA